MKKKKQDLSTSAIPAKEASRGIPDSTPHISYEEAVSALGLPPAPQKTLSEALSAVSLATLPQTLSQELSQQKSQSPSKNESSALNKKSRSTLKEYAQKTISNEALQEIMTAADFKQTMTDCMKAVEKVVSEAQKAQIISQRTQTEITSRIQSDFKKYFSDKQALFKTGFNRLFSENDSGISLYETTLSNARTLNVGYHQHIKAENKTAFTGIKQTEDGKQLIKTLSEAGELKDVLSVSIKNQKEDAPLLTLGYAAGGSVYTPKEAGVAYMTANQNLSDHTKLNVAMEGNDEAVSLMTSLQRTPENKQYNQALDLGVSDQNVAVDMQMSYKDTDSSLKATGGIINELMAGKIAYEKQISETQKLELQALYTDSFALSASYSAEQANALHKLGLLITQIQSSFNYTYQNATGAFAEASVKYTENQEKPAEFDLRIGYSHEW